MNDGFIDMNGLMLLRKAIGILIELIVKMKVRVDYLDKDPKDIWGLRLYVVKHKKYLT